VTALTWLGVVALGAVGAVARFELDRAVARRARGDFPWGTLVVNVSGAFTAGAVAGAGVGGRAATLIAVGALASFTTFSTWMLETHRLLEEGRGRVAAANLAVGFGAGLGAAVLGWAVGALA
jgi:CrcB protein